MNEQKSNGREPLDEERYEQLSRFVESDDFDLPNGTVATPGHGDEPGRDFLAQYLTEDELRAASRRGRGRPSLSGAGRSPSRQVRLPADLDALLVERAAHEGRPMSDVLREAVASYLRPPAA